MKSRISYFDNAVFRKDITRFFPAWLLYGIFLLLALVMMLDGASSYSFAQNIATFTSAFGVINLAYAMLNAQLLFGDLYNSRMCNALHALPMRRETWFCSHILAGLWFSVVPNAALSLILIPFLEELWYLALYWLLGATLSYLFCFGVAVFSAMCVGNRFAMAVVYGLIHFFSLLAYWVYATLYEPMLYGIRSQGELAMFLSPVLQLSILELISVTRVTLDNLPGIWDTVVTFQGWWYLGGVALVGIAMGAAALLLYRRRHLESAGDFVVVKPLVPVFLVLYTLAAGTMLQLMFSLFIGNDDLVFLFIGMAIGFFTGKMLLDRTPRVFHKKAVLQFAAFMACMVLTLVLTAVDILGITRWVPDASDVKSAYFYTSGSYYHNEQDGNTIPAEDAIRLHEIALENRPNGGEYANLTLTYTLKSGLEVTRNYYIPVTGEALTIVARHKSTPEAVLGITLQPGESYLDHILCASFYFEDEVKVTGDQLASLLEAIVKDCQAGHMIQDWSFHENSNGIYITLEYAYDLYGRNYAYRDIRVFSDCYYTYEWLLANGFVRIEFTK